VDELKVAHNDAQQARIALWEQLASTPAQTVFGIAVKLAALMHYDDGFREAWEGKSPIDIPTEMFLAARADAVRLAGLPEIFGVDAPQVEFDEGSEDA
jgi:hypothetical protein